MEEIRHLRTKMIQSIKLREKHSKQSDRICRAIIKDVDYKKLAIDATSAEIVTKTKIDMINQAIEGWRQSLDSMLKDIFRVESEALAAYVNYEASSQAIQDAATEMALKYHYRTKKPKRRRQKRTVSSTPPTSPSNQRASPLRHPHNNHPSPQPQVRTPPTATPKSPQNVRSSHSPRPSTFTTNWNRQPTSPTTQTAHQPGQSPEGDTFEDWSKSIFTMGNNTHHTGSTTQSSLKTFFRATKKPRCRHRQPQGATTTKPPFRF